MTALFVPAAGGPSPATEPHSIEGRAPLLLDILMGLSVVAGLLAVPAMLEGPEPALSWAGGYVAIVVAMSTLWVGRRLRERRTRRPARGLVVAFVALGALGPFAANEGAWPLFLMALLALFGCFPPTSGVVVVVLLLFAQFIVFVVSGRSLPDTLLQVGGSAFIFGFGLVLAWLMAEYVRQRQRIAGLLTEVRHGQAAEVELVLADERTRAARDLHDGLGHRLTLIGMALTFADRMRDRDADRAWEQVERARFEAGEALTTMRRWVRALSPVRVEGATLGVALDAVAESFRGTGLDVIVRGSATPPELDRTETLFLHRFVQEGLTNALRHSAAARVQVDYEIGSDNVLLRGER